MKRLSYNVQIMPDIQRRCDRCQVEISGYIGQCYGHDKSTTMLNPFHAETTFRPWQKNAKNLENHLNPVMLVFIGKLSTITNK